MTTGGRIGPDLGVTVSAEVEHLLGDSTVTFGGVVPESCSAREIHWLTQMSSHEMLVASNSHPGGGMLATVRLIERTDDQGRTWVCVTSSAWTVGLFLSRTEGLDFAVDVALRETPKDGWNYASDYRIPAASDMPFA